MRASGLSAVVVLIALAAPAQAQEIHPGVIEYTAAPECPDRDTFTRRVEERLPKNGVIVPETTAKVTVEAREGEYLARLEVADPNTASSREVRGASCTEVSEAMALIVALALTGQMEPETVAAGPPVAAPPETAPEPSKPAPAEPDRQPEVVPPVQKDEPAPAPTPLQWLLGAAATATGGLAPNPAWGALLFVETGAIERATARVSAGARATFSAEQELDSAMSPGGQDTAATRFDWFGARVDGCLTPLSAHGRAFLSTCLALEGGWQRGHSRGIERPSDEGALWVAAALLARPRLALGSVVLEAEGGPLVPILRDDFVIQTGPNPNDQEPVHEPPDVSWTAAVGVALSVW